MISGSSKLPAGVRLVENDGTVTFHFSIWSDQVYVLIPGAVYAGNRFPAFPSTYPPMVAPRAASHPDRTLQISEIPRLKFGPGESRLMQTTADAAVPGIGFHFPNECRWLWVLVAPCAAPENAGFLLEESADRSSASLVITLPKAEHPVLIQTGAGESRQSLFDALVPLRNALAEPPTRVPMLPFSEAWRILEEKQNRENWMDAGGYYAVGTEPVRRQHWSQNWQMGWTGGMISAHAMILRGAELSVERALKSFDFVFPKGQGRSGFFLGMGNGTDWRGDHFSDPAAPWHLIRKSADGLYFMAGSLLHLHRIGQSDRIKESWLAGLTRCANAFVTVWDRDGQFGQFVDHDTGEILVANSTSGALVPAALLRAARLLPEFAPEYRRVAAESGRFFVRNDLASAVTSGGPGDAAQCPDSESITGLLESLVDLYDETGDGFWLEAAKDAAVQLSSWVVSYDFTFPPESTFAKLGMRSAGTVLANAQNKHSAPGFCTHAGAALLRLYQITREPFFMDLLRDVAHTLPQFLSRADRLIPFGIPYGSPDDPSQTWLNPGWMNERVNLVQWGPDEHPGEVFYCSCWPEISLMLTIAELPGVYVCKESRRIWCLDHVDAVWDDDGVLTIRNPTGFPASVRVTIDGSGGPVCHEVFLNPAAEARIR